MAFFGVKGGSKSKKSKNGMRGGSDLSPASFGGANGQPTIPANYVKMPNTFPSKQVGGSYGFSDSGDSKTYGGSYAPWSKSCTSGAIAGRGGNDVMSGGRRKRSSTKRKSSTKRRRSSKRKSSTKRKSKSKKGGKKYSQRGCSKKMKGGLIVF
jgi:hypothetical protein